MKLKKTKNTTLIAILACFIAIISMATMSCTENNPIRTRSDNHEEVEQFGDVYVRLVDARYYYLEKHFVVVEDFLQSYSEYVVKITPHHNDGPLECIFRLTYNHELIDEAKLIELLENDERVCSVTSQPEWVRNEMTINLHYNTPREQIEDFINSYSMYRVKLLFHDRQHHRIRVSFDNTILDEDEFLMILFEDERVTFASYFRALPDWEQGVILAKLVEPVTEKMVEEFLYSYAEYEIELISYIGNYEWILLKFNHLKFDEFDFLDLVKKDPRVFLADFNHFNYPAGPIAQSSHINTILVAFDWLTNLGV